MASRVPTKMLDQARKVLALIEPRFRGPLVLLLFVTVSASLLEVISITAVLPMFDIMLDPERMGRAEWFHGIFGDTAPRSVFLWACLAIVVLFVAKSCVSTFAIWLKWQLQSRLYQDLSGTLLRSYLNSPLSFHLHHGPPELLRNLGQFVSQTTQYGFLGLVDLTSDGLLCGGIFVALTFVEPLISSIAFLFIGTLAALYVLIGQPYFIRWGRRYKAASGRVYQIAMEPFTGIKTVKVLGCEDFFEQQFRRVNSEFCDILRNNAVTGAMPRQLLELVAVSSLVGMIIWAILDRRDPATLIPILAVFAAAAYRIMPAVVRMTSTLQNFRFSHEAIEILYADVMRAKTVAGGVAAPPRKQNSGGDIVLSGASFTYDGAKHPALDGVDLTIRSGEVVAFVGSSGAGKTTLADVILGLHRLDCGMLSIDGTRYANSALIPRGTFGYVPQEPFLIDDTIRRNIALGLPDNEIDEDRLQTAIKLAAADRFVSELPHGLDTVVGDRGVRLSGGQRQRIGIARAMYADSDIFVFDEATSSVDTTTEAEITNAIGRLHGMKTIIVIAHRLSTVKQCDRIFYLKAGRIVDFGRYDELIRLNADFAAMVRQMDFEGRPRDLLERA
jgi:ABC-type multidrug transport system fused ATPase/permease subunit